MPTAADVGAVPTSRTINGKALTGNITITAADIGTGAIFLASHPVGSLFETTVSTNPGTLYGGESNGLLDRPKMKTPVSVDWPDYHGEVFMRASTSS